MSYKTEPVFDTEKEYETVIINDFSDSNYDMNVLEEYMSLFGNPYNQTVKTVIQNVKRLMWPNEEIQKLFEEMMDETYENIMNESDPGYSFVMENVKVFNK